jgi:hypothetical protein
MVYIRRMINRKIRVPVALLLPLLLSGCASVPRDLLYPAAPTLLPGTSAEMNSPGYWIGRHPEPDRTVLDVAGVDALNARIREQKLVRDLTVLTEVSGSALRAELAAAVDWIGRLAVYQESGYRVDSSFLGPLDALEDRSSIPDAVEPSYGFLAQRADLRVLPTAAALYDAPGDRFIDNLQASSLEPGTPVAVLHRSRDGAWVYAATELASGWLPADSVASASADAFRARLAGTDRFVVVAARADLYKDPLLTRSCGYLRMGTTLPAAPEAPAEGAVAVLLPARNEAGDMIERTVWIDSSQMHAGFLPYTARTIYRQAFALLDAPYGWGGTFGERDCSQFLCEVFATVGVVLPRNSSAQAKIGVLLEGFSVAVDEGEKARLLAAAGLPGATLLRLPGHIMLYLGAVDGKPYIIHSTWAYRERRLFSDVQRLVNRVAVSTLDLGTGSSRGSHLGRLTTATVVALP